MRNSLILPESPEVRQARLTQDQLDDFINDSDAINILDENNENQNEESILPRINTSPARVRKKIKP